MEAGKKAAAIAAVGYIKPQSIVGIGSGSTVAYFIEALASASLEVQACVPSSQQSEAQLLAHKLPVVSMNEVDHIDVYIDGADEIDAFGHCIKGGGAALTREKILAHLAKQFICIADESKRVKVLGQAHPLPVEVLDFARSALARQFVVLGARPSYREGVITDNGHVILDVLGLDLTQAASMNKLINHLPGVVAHGLFVDQKPHILLLGGDSGVEVVTFGGAI